MTYQETPYQKVNIVDADGTIISIGGPSNSSGGDASAINQTAQIAVETVIRDRLPSVLVGGRLPIDGSGVIQPISATNLPLPTGAATESTLGQVRDAIKAQIDIASTIWTDNSGAFYVRRDIVNESLGTISTVFTDPLGATTTTTGPGLRPLSTVDKDTVTDFYDVITNGTGYSVGNLLASVTVLDVNSGTPSATFVWLNISLGTILGTAPIAANIERANENVGARQVGSWTVALSSVDAGNLLNLSNAIGTPITGATMPTGGVGLYGWLSGIWKLLSDRLAALGANTAANSTPVTLATDGIFAIFAGLANDTASITGSIHAKLRAIATSLVQGQAIMANSLSMAIASDQTAIAAIASQSDVREIRDRSMPPGTSITYLGTSAGANIKNSPGAINSFICSNNHSTLTRYFQIFNKITAPVLGDIPAFIPIPVFPNNAISIVDQATIGGTGIILSIGCSCGYSTTQFTYTPAPVSECGLTVRFT